MVSTTKTSSLKKPIAKITISLLALFSILAVLIFTQKNRILQQVLGQMNEDFNGKVVIEEAQISPFVNFPYISIDLKKLEIHETKDITSDTVLFIQDAYIGFDLGAILSGDVEIKKIKLENGFLNLVQFEDGTLNAANAFSNDLEEQLDVDTTESKSQNFSLEAIELLNIDILKHNQASNILVEAFIEEAKASFSSIDEHVKASLDSRFLFNLILEGDTSFIHDKHVQISSAVDYDLNTELLQLEPSEVFIEQAAFGMEGSIDVKNDLFLDLKFTGQKPNFDLFLAFAPPELNPILQRYDNGGSVYFDVTVQGASINGFTPHVEANFGCSEAFVENTTVDKEVKELQFKGFFTNGDENNNKTSKLIIEDFKATPETGSFEGALIVQNFDAPDVDMQIDADFNLAFLTGFFNLDQLEDVSGKIALQMNFHDIIDLDNPSTAIERLNESYFTSLSVENLNFTSPGFHLPLKNINIEAFMDGHKAIVEKFEVEAGGSDVSMTASISDLPAILHHTDLPVAVDLDIKSKMLDLAEFTQSTAATGVDEQIKNLSLGLRFNSTARAFTESPNLPLGEFFITNLTAQMSKYPHRLHDFDADVIIDSIDFKVIDFTGMIDKSDFHFNGKLKNYDLWFDENPKGETEIDFNLTSDMLALQDIFSYGGENYVPEDYRKEVFEELKIHALTTMNFDKKLKSVNLAVDKVEAYLQQHQFAFERFKGDFLMDSLQFKVTNAGGKIGNSEVVTNMTYYRKPTPSTPPHEVSIKSAQLDFDQLFSYIPPSENEEVNHEEAFNVFEIPFANVNFEMEIGKLNYHRYLIDDFLLQGRMQEDHYLYVDTLMLKTADGRMDVSGYFNGSNPESIYFSPQAKVQKMDLEKLLFKFENFGQDALISDNLEGSVSGTVEGKVKMYPDLIPIIDDSELALDVEIVDGALKNFSAFDAMATYFTDKNLNYVRFDTLRNTFTLKNGALEIPNMVLNTSVGYFQISGKQYVDERMDYLIRVPMKVIARAGVQKLFTKKNQDNTGQIDAIQYKDETKRTRYLNIQVTGTPDDFEIGLGKD